MKRINLKLLIILIVSAVVFFGGVYSLHEFQSRRRADGLLILAEQRQKAGEFAKEAQIRKSYLGRRPEAKDQYGLIAEAYSKVIEQNLSEGTFRPEIFQQAFAFYENGVRSDPTNAELRKSAIAFFIRMRRFKDAISHLEYLKSQQDGKLEPLLESQLAMCYLRGGEESRARAMLSSMVGFDGQGFDDEAATAPDSLEAHQLLAVIYTTARRPDISKLVLDHLVQRNPESAEAYLARARQFYETDPERAKPDFQKALELAPENEEILLACSQVAVDEGNWVKAEELCNRCLTINPKNITALRGLAVAAVTQNRSDAAIAFIDRALEISPTNLDLLMLRVDFQLRLRKLEAVEETIVELRDLGLPRFYRDYLSGRLHHAKGEWYDAVSKLEEARPHIEQNRPPLLNQVDLLLAQCYEQLGQHDRRLNAMQAAVVRNPTNLQFRWFKIQALLALKRIDDALVEYRDIRGQLTRFSATSEQFLIQHLQLELMRQKSIRDEDARDFTEAKKLVERVIKAKRINTAVKTTTLATYFEMIGEQEKAENLMRRLQTTASNSPAMRLGTIKSRGYESDGLEDALSQLDNLTEEAGDLVPFRLLRAELLAARKPDGFEQQLGDLAENADHYRDQEKFALWTELGRYQMIVGRHSETLSLWRRAKSVSPDNLDLLMKIYDVALLSDDESQIRSAANDLRKLTGDDSAEWKWAQAARITLDIRNGKKPKSELANAQGLVDEAIEIRDEWEQLFRLRGEIAALQGRKDVAIGAYQKAIELGSTNIGLHRKLARMYYADGQLGEAEKVLGNLPRSAWTKMEEQIHLDLLSRAGKLPEEVAYDKESKDPADHIFMGQLFAKSGRYDDAEAALQRAIELDTKAPSTWGAQIQYFVLRGMPEKAASVIETAAPQLPEDNQSIFLATSYGMLGEWQKSIDYYQQAIAEKPNEQLLRMGLANSQIKLGKTEDAKKVLSELVASDSGEFSTPTVAMARRTLAEITAASGTYEDYQEAIRLLEENEQRLGALTNADLVLSARLSARRVERATRREALRKMELVQERGTLSDGAKLIMAELYYSLGDWGAAQSLMLDMLSRNPSDPPLIEKWLAWLLERGDLRQAARWVDNADPQMAVYLRTKVLVDANNGRIDRAIQRLKAVVPKELNEQSLPILRTVAMLAEEVGKYDAQGFSEAEALWKAYIRAKRDSILELAMHYRRTNEPSNAIKGFKVCKKAIEMGQGPLAIQTGLDLLRKFKDG